MFQKGKELPIFVTSVSKVGSVCWVWAQTDFESFADVEELMENVEPGDSTRFTPVSISKLAVGSVVLAKYTEDGNWYRAQVKSIQKASSECRVFFMDYGNEETVSVSDMVYGPKEYFEAPPLADKFILGGLKAQDGSAFSPSETGALHEHLTNLDTVACVLHQGASGVPPTLQLFFEKFDRTPMTDILFESGCGTSYQNDHINFRHIRHGMLPPGHSHNVYVSYMESPVNFWLQLASQEDVLFNLDAELQDIIPNLSPLPPAEIQCGQTCIAKYEECDIYYRGVVSSLDNQNQVANVTFIDYGNSVEIAFSEVLRLPEKFSSLPAQAVQCSLKGSAVNSTDMDKLIESENVYARVLKVLDSGLHIVHVSNESADASTEKSPSQTMPVVTSYVHLQLSVEAPVDVCISHVEETGQFYCQLLERANGLDRLMCDIKDSTLSPLKGAIKEGTCCLARSPRDGVTYRAQILSGTVAGPHVHYVDFGVRETVPAPNLYYLPADFSEIPVYAVCCTLAESSHLTNQRVLSLLNKYDSKQPLVAKVLHKTPKSHEVALYDTSESDEPLVHIVNRDICPADQSSHRTTSHQVAEASPSSLQSPNIALGQPTGVIGCVILKPPTVFFAQFANYPVEDLERLGEKLHDFYTKNDVPRLSSCSAGDLCVSQYSEDGAYYRARVKDCRGDLALVTFVDYGNQEKKKISELKILAPQFCDIPVAGALFDIGKYHEVNSPEQFGEVLVDQELTVLCTELDSGTHRYISKLPNVDNNAAILRVAR